MMLECTNWLSAHFTLRTDGRVEIVTFMSSVAPDMKVVVAFFFCMFCILFDTLYGQNVVAT